MEQIEAKSKYDPKLELSSYDMPPIELLADNKWVNAEVTDEEHTNNKNKIVETFRKYGIEIVEIIKANQGPTVTLYEITPAPGLKISTIKNLENDITLSLALRGSRIIAPMPMKGTIGIEMPNRHPQIVSLRTCISSQRFQVANMELPIALGKTFSNETFVFDLTKTPNILVTGSHGQGKSVCINAIIASILYKKHPSQVKLVLVDSKSVEFTIYENIERHFLAKLPDSEEAIITIIQKVINTVNSLCMEMDMRFNLLKNAGVRNVKEYNNRLTSLRLDTHLSHRYLPYIVVIIDDYADYVMAAGKEIEMPIARLAQKALNVGIYLIIVTQRPATNIITDVIKATFPVRIAFRDTSPDNSRYILDRRSSADRLIGGGDLFFTLGGGGDLTRVQCAFIDYSEIEEITRFIGKQASYPTCFLLPQYIGEVGVESKEIDLNKKDDLFDDAARLIVTHQIGSTSLVQRTFSLGYIRAGRIIAQLEEAGIVGTSEGSNTRQVLFTDMASLEKYLKKMKKKSKSKLFPHL